MPFQSSGIIVVDKKTSVVSQQEHQVPTQIQSQQIVHQQFLQPQQQHKKSSVLTRQILNNQSSSSGPSGNIIRSKHQKVIYGISSSCSTSGTTTATSIVGDSINNITKTNNNVLQNCAEDLQHSQQIAISTNSTIPNKNLMRRHQRLLSNSTATTIIQQNQQLQQYSSPSSNIEIQQQQIMNSQSQQQNLTPTTQFVGGNQIIQVSEEYLEHATAQGAQIVNITPSDLINSQFIKLINSDGNQQNVIIDSLGNITTGNQNSNQNSSKLLVGNLTTVLKPNNTSSTAGGGGGQSAATVAQLQQSPTQQQQINFLNAKQIPYLATASSSPTVSGSTKSPNSVQKIVNIPLKTNNIVKTGNNLLQQQQQQNIQKIQMPRNVQVVTRVQQQPQQQPGQQQIVMQPKYLNNSTTKLNNNLVKKQTINQMKVQQHKITNLSSGGNQQVKTFIHQQPQQPQQQQQQYSTIQQPSTPVKQLKSQKLIKQFNHNLNNSTVLLQQQLSNTAGCYQLNNSKFPQKLNSGNKLNNSAIKYVMQNHIVTPSTNQQQTKNSAIQQQTIPNSIVVNQQIINPLQQQSNQSGTIKFVNAHGAVLQTSTTNSPTHRIKNNNIVQQQHHFIDQNGKIINFLNENDYQTTAKTTFLSNTSSTGQQQHQQQQQQHQQQQQSSINDDIVIVNGTQMTDEVSARILQSMAQKSYSNQRQQQQQQYVQQQQKNLHQPSSPIAQQQQNVGLPREYPIYSPQNVQQYQTNYQQSPRQVLSQPNSRTQSLDRKHNYESKKSQHTLSSSTLSVNSNLNQTSSDYYRVNSKDIHKNYTSPSSNTTSITNKSFSNDNNLNHNTTTTTFIDNVSLPLSRGDNTSVAQQAEHDDDIIGEEVRPIPVSTNDLKLLALHAFLQDHTYVAPMPARLPLELCSQKSSKPTSVSTSCSITATTMTSQQAISHVLPSASGNIIGNNSTMVISDSKLLSQSPQNHQYVITANNLNHGIQLQSQQSNFSSALGQHGFSSGGYSFVQHGGPANSQQLHQIQSNQTPTKILQLQQSPKNQIECNNNQQQHLDDDANSVISNDSRNDGHQGRLEMDLGEETETAPEAEAEDDSVTRCICDFTHDDGYMICCDKCFAWQHVDCMGIDRQNIPEEYLCEICQERPVDKIKARALQNQKRREIQAQLLLNSQINQSSPPTATANNSNAVQSQVTPELQIVVQEGQTVNTAAPNPADYKALGLTKKGKPKKSELLKLQKAMAKKERQANKRKENKRQTKRKYKNSDKVSKDEDNLRQWIENYEVAVTNHYSPELRARLHSIYKQPQLLQIINAHENKWLKNCQNMESKGTTIPHGGGKILISNFDIPPNSAIIELCGRYMLTTQFKTQNPSLNMNSLPTQIQTPLKSHRTPGPFIFFYQMPSDAGSGPEVCVDTRTYGNDARFVRRSCRPNAELQYSFEKGAIHLFIVSLTNIMASTEITIRHEPHDLIALENKTYPALQIAPTSTKCACGLMKDCIFGVPTTPIPTDTPSDNNNFVPKEKKLKKKIPNGAESAATSTATLTKKQLKKQLGNRRGRSTSSSGESNAGLLSPNPNLFPPTAVVLPTQNLFGTTVISNIHDSGIYTSSSSPSIPSPTHQQSQVMHSPTPPIIQQQLLMQQPTQVIALPSPLTLPQAQLYTTTSGIAQQGSPQLILQQISANQQVQIVTTVPSTQSTSQLHSPILPTQQLPVISVPPPPQISPQLQPPIVAIQPQLIPVQLQSPQKSITAASTVPESISTSVQQIHVPKQAQQPKVLQKIPTPTKVESPTSFTQTTSAMAPPPPQVQLPVEAALQVSLTTPAQAPTTCIVQSQNENLISTSNTAPKSIAPQNLLKSPQKVQVKKTPKSRTTSSSEETQANEVNTDPTKRDIRKLTREERKMEAIVKAFEKMEKNQQRKKELKQQRGPQKRRKSNSPSSKRSKQRFPGDDNENLKKNPIRKKKRKGPTKTYVMQTSTQRKRRRSRINSNESDAASEDSSCMLSPPLPRSSNNYDQNTNTIHRSLECTEKLLIDDLIESQPKSDTENQAAGLLLAFANHPKKCENSPPKVIQQQIAKTPQPKMSSACLLIESALGLCNSTANLATTKTKKSLMSDWLNQSNEEEQNVNNPSPMENLVQAAMVDYKASQSSFTNPDESHNLSIVAKKVEEFIIQTDSSSLQQSDFNKFEILNAQAGISHNFAETQAIQNSANFQTCSNSAAKKRWLRQAISEETTDVESHSQSQKAYGASNPITSLQTSASNSPISNGFTTPLKKRRLVVLKDSNNDEGIIDEEMGNGSASPDDSQNIETEEQPLIKIEDIIDEFANESKKVLTMKDLINENDDDVDILRSPSPDSKKIVAENLNLVKIQPEDADDKEIKIDVEKDSDIAADVIKKVETTVETVVKQEEVFDEEINTSIVALIDVPKVETAEGGQQVSETKLEEQKDDVEIETTIKTEKNVIQKIKPITKQSKINLKKQQPQEDQNINALKLSPDLKTSPIEKNSTNNNAEDEIANIQMKLQSFHTENIMILQSRNKKSKSRTAKTESFESDCKSPKIKNKDEKFKYSSISKKDDRTRKVKSFPKYDDSDEDVKQKRFKFNNDKIEKQKKRRESSASTSSSRSGEDHKYPSEDSRNDSTSKFRDEYVNKYSTIKKDNFHHYNTAPVQSQQSAATPLANYGATPIISSYLNTASIQSYDKFINNANYIAQNSKLPVAIPQQSATFVPSQLLHTNFNSQPIHAISTNSCISHPQQSQFYPIYNKPPQPLNAIQASQPSSLSLQTVSKNLLLSEYLDDSKPKSFSTLGAYMSTAASSSTLFGLSRSVSENGPITLNKSNPITPILTKTTSHDPRLNPQLTLPEPAPTPKRKLSINEYRKRKQQSTESVSSLNSQESTPDINSNKFIVENGGDLSSKSEKDVGKEVKTPEGGSNNSEDTAMLINNLEQRKSRENNTLDVKKNAVDTDQNEQNNKTSLKNQNEPQISNDKSLNEDIDAKIDTVNNIPTASNNKLTDLANSDSVKKETNQSKESNESKT